MRLAYPACSVPPAEGLFSAMHAADAGDTLLGTLGSIDDAAGRVSITGVFETHARGAPSTWRPQGPGNFFWQRWAGRDGGSASPPGGAIYPQSIDVNLFSSQYHTHAVLSVRPRPSGSRFGASPWGSGHRRTPSLDDVTRILADIEQGDPEAVQHLRPLVHDELRTFAAPWLANEKPRRRSRPPTRARSSGRWAHSSDSRI